MEVIDLTLSDSEDESDMARPQSSHEISSGCVSPPVISIDSPAGPLSISSASSFDNISSSQSNSSYSPNLSSSPSSSSSSNSTIGYNYPGPSGSRSPPLQSPTSSPRSHLVPRSPYKSPIQIPLSPIASPHPMSPLAVPASSFLPPFPTMPPSMSIPMPNIYMSAPASSMSSLPIGEDREIEEFLQGLYNEYRWYVAEWFQLVLQMGVLLTCRRLMVLHGTD